MYVLINNRHVELKSNTEIRNFLLYNPDIDNIRINDSFWVKAPKLFIPNIELSNVLGACYLSNPLGTHWVLLNGVDYFTWKKDKTLSSLKDKVEMCLNVYKFYTKILY